MLYEGLAIRGGGAIMRGLVLGAIGACIVDRDFSKAAAFAAVGAVLTFFGFMHGEAIGIDRTPMVAFAYVLVAGWLYGWAKYSTVTKAAPVRPAPAAAPADWRPAPSPARLAGRPVQPAGASPPAAPG